MLGVEEGLKVTKLFVFSSACISLIALPALAQQNMERFLDAVDSPSSWSRTPVPMPANNPQAYAPTNSLYQNPVPQQYPGQMDNTQMMRQQMLRTLFGSNPSLGGRSPSSNINREKSKADWGSSTAYSDWQEAENQASKAHNAEEKARYEKDKWRSKDDASEAYYAANAARNASDRVYYASLKGDPTAREYVDRAKAAADRAHADSGRARYYADTKN